MFRRFGTNQLLIPREPFWAEVLRFLKAFPDEKHVVIVSTLIAAQFMQQTLGDGWEILSASTHPNKREELLADLAAGHIKGLIFSHREWAALGWRLPRVAISCTHPLEDEWAAQLAARTREQAPNFLILRTNNETKRVWARLQDILRRRLHLSGKYGRNFT